MNYAVGYSFNSNELFANFNTRRLKVTSNELQILYGDRHKKTLCAKVFRDCCKLVLADVVNNDVEFLLPTGSRRSSIMMVRIKDELFKKARRNGKFREVDFLASMFSGYVPVLYIYGHRDIPKTKTIYLNKELRDKIVENTNNKFVYYGRTVTNIHNYEETVLAMYPSISKQDICRILNYGWKSLYLLNSYGADTLVQDNTFWFYIGALSRDSLKHFNYYAKKLAIKLRILYKRNKPKWDGYYYFALGEKQYQNYLQLLNKRGRKRKYFIFGPTICYKNYDECNILHHNSVAIFKTSYCSDLGYTFFNLEFKPNNCELVLTREPLKFKDILITNNDFKYL